MTKRPFREEGDQIMDSFGMAKALILLSRGAGVAGVVDEAELQVGMQQHHPAGRVFECKTCNRKFPSFQALGGHRASHKKPRLAAGDQLHGQAQAAALQAKAPRVHECSICGLEFAIGQALGGHMRRHRSASCTEGFPQLVPLLETTKKTAAAGAGDGEKRPSTGVLCLDLDLNQLPPADHEVVDVRCALSFSLGPPPMVCLQPCTDEIPGHG